MKLTRKCAICKEDCRKEEMIQYTSYSGKTSHWLCRDCYTQKINREAFSNKVCQIFQIKTPGPRIWADRKKIQEKYGYTDQIIIDCLDYLYKVQNTKILSESLCLVTPTNVEKMLQYKKTQLAKAQLLAAAANQEIKEHIVPIKEIEERKKEILNPDDFLDE